MKLELLNGLIDAMQEMCTTQVSRITPLKNVVLATQSYEILSAALATPTAHFSQLSIVLPCQFISGCLWFHAHKGQQCQDVSEDMVYLCRTHLQSSPLFFFFHFFFILFFLPSSFLFPKVSLIWPSAPTEELCRRYCAHCAMCRIRLACSWVFGWSLPFCLQVRVT